MEPVEINLWMLRGDLYVITTDDPNDLASHLAIRGSVIDALGTWYGAVNRSLPGDWGNWDRALAASLMGLLAEIPPAPTGWWPTVVFDRDDPPHPAYQLRDYQASQFAIGCRLNDPDITTIARDMVPAAIAWAENVRAGGFEADHWRKRVAL
ncbi:MAG: hypothetical protein QG671_4528 [Actinomycetota bacterium]|jgi:hypothetical protein|nr:hypothetical protein [Actinomycetota bacterium]